MLVRMVILFDGLIDRFLLTSSGFEKMLRAVQSEQWTWPTPCTEWTVRQLVNHVTRGNLNYVRLLHGGDGAGFLRLRDADALGTDPTCAYTRSVQECARAFGRAGALQQVLDYPLGPVTGQQALAVRITDTTVHTWDLARAVGLDDTLDPSLVAWIDEHLDDIYQGLPETPTAVETTHRFFAVPPGVLDHDASQQMRLLHRMGRTPRRDH
ncbi:TIGR03086 family metal-binding protein [Streptomyces sp. RB6PN25]|uniref:TIGR03086 family metal-binding protein n=1 Tax=Streptomyces humicola TaxID=2953240 RepID=A0ABT1Q3Z2_9ACTN|nr:TIGR03086 family metal-binding protein [Streptomyces humicola]MCQ4083495.1 TIGR03086 family metal-binding protein [Streptomyces humicola]